MIDIMAMIDIDIDIMVDVDGSGAGGNGKIINCAKKDHYVICNTYCLWVYYVTHLLFWGSTLKNKNENL